MLWFMGVMVQVMQLPKWTLSLVEFFFIGIFLSIIFMMGTVLVIYYKQISEGYEDRERFVILQKVGLDQKLNPSQTY